MRHNDHLRDKLVTYLQDACAMERQLVQVLEGQVNDTSNYPRIQAGIQQHLDETRMHEQRMAERLDAYHERPSALKSLGTTLLGSIAGAISGARTDDLSKALRDDYAAEHMEIAAYELLIGTAQLCGDNETIMAAQANLRDEARMASWLEQHLADTVVYSFQRDGVALDDAQIPLLRQTALNALQGAQSGLGSMTARPRMRDDRGGGARGYTGRRAVDRGLRDHGIADERDLRDRDMSDERDIPDWDLREREMANPETADREMANDELDERAMERDMGYDRDLIGDDQDTTPPNAL